MSTVNQEERARRAWDVLVEQAALQRTITYGELGRRLGIHHRPARYFLEPIQTYCLENKLPPLSILVVGQSGRPGPGFIAWDINNLDEGLHRVFEHNWQNEANPFQYASGGATLDDLAREVLTGAISPAVAYARVKVRGIVQIMFRSMLLKVYDSTCAVCGFPYRVGLDAAHIKPWAKCTSAERLDVRNGLLLCRNHHALFDAGILVIDDDLLFAISASNANANATQDPQRKHVIEGRLKIPAEQRHQPSREYVAFRIAGQARKQPA
jgi:putative restriction endonuclease